MGSGRGILSVTGAVDPEPLTALILNTEVVADGDKFGIAFPPLPEDPFGTVRTLHPPADTAPGEAHRRMIRKKSESLDRLWR